MRALSLWQPWATAIAVGAKRIETRDWSTAYRGPLLIHAAKRVNKAEMREYGADLHWLDALHPAGLVPGGGKPLWDLLPLGAVVAVCNLVDCRPTECFDWAELNRPRHHEGQVPHAGWTEAQMGNFGPGRFGWVLADIQPLPQPVPFKGGQGFFNVPRELVALDPLRLIP